MDKKELFKTGTKEEVDKKSETVWCRVEFAVTCDSSPYIEHEKSVAARVAKYVNDCVEAMDESMRHWGDHHHCIEPLVVKVYDNNNEDPEAYTEIQDELDKYWIPNLDKYDIKKIEENG